VEAFRARKADVWNDFCEQSEAACGLLEAALEAGDPNGIRAGIDEAGDCLLQLARDSGVEIVTPELSRALEIARGLGVSAKIAGAGGGDCVLAVAFDDDAVRALKKEADARLLVAFPCRVAEGLSWA
jgi:phosphomevalonate kinase